VAEHYNIRLSDMIGPKRLRTIARPRQVAMYLAKNLTTAQPARDRAALRRARPHHDHARRRRIEELKGKDNQIAEDLELLRRALEA
jgi:chromosomal replication initiator protein